MDFGQLICVHVGSSVVINIPLCWGLLIMREAMHCVQIWVYGKSLYLSQNCAVNFKFSKNIKSGKKNYSENQVRSYYELYNVMIILSNH